MLYRGYLNFRKAYSNLGLLSIKYWQKRARKVSQKLLSAGLASVFLATSLSPVAAMRSGGPEAMGMDIPAESVSTSAPSLPGSVSEALENIKEGGRESWQEIKNVWQKGGDLPDNIEASEKFSPEYAAKVRHRINVPLEAGIQLGNIANATIEGTVLGLSSSAAYMLKGLTPTSMKVKIPGLVKETLGAVDLSNEKVKVSSGISKLIPAAGNWLSKNWNNPKIYLYGLLGTAALVGGVYALSPLMVGAGNLLSAPGSLPIVADMGKGLWSMSSSLLGASSTVVETLGSYMGPQMLLSAALFKGGYDVGGKKAALGSLAIPLALYLGGPLGSMSFSMGGSFPQIPLITTGINFATKVASRAAVNFCSKMTTSYMFDKIEKRSLGKSLRQSAVDSLRGSYVKTFISEGLGLKTFSSFYSLSKVGVSFLKGIRDADFWEASGAYKKVPSASASSSSSAPKTFWDAWVPQRFQSFKALSDSVTYKVTKGVYKTAISSLFSS